MLNKFELTDSFYILMIKLDIISIKIVARIFYRIM
jgi:hypothetical protein